MMRSQNLLFVLSFACLLSCRPFPLENEHPDWSGKNLILNTRIQIPEDCANKRISESNGRGARYQRIFCSLSEHHARDLARQITGKMPMPNIWVGMLEKEATVPWWNIDLDKWHLAAAKTDGKNYVRIVIYPLDGRSDVWISAGGNGR